MFTNPYALLDEQWAGIEALLPGREGHVGVTAKDNRLFIDAVLYRYRAGITWRELPAHFGDFRVVHTRYMRWLKSGVWQKIMNRLSKLETELQNEQSSFSHFPALPRGHLPKTNRVHHFQGYERMHAPSMA